MATVQNGSRLPVANKDFTEAAVVIVGAGISGMCMAIDLLKRNQCQNFIVIEKSAGLGGTWRDSRYPGCCCDVWAHLYSYSFEPNPDWTREYAGQEEILNYLMGVAHKHELYRYIRFNTAVEKVEWNDITKTWTVAVKVSGGKEAEFGSSYTITSQYLVSAVGQLNVPNYPALDGLERFGGKLMHSARWDWTYGLKEKRVAVIGVGSTAAQIVPEVAKIAHSVTVYQRTPNWIVPRMDSFIPSWKRILFKWLPYFRRRKRSQMMNYREGSYQAVVKPAPGIGQQFEALCMNHMRTQLPERQDLWAKFTPKYTPGCKRVIMSDDFYPAFLRDNVRLEGRKITKVTNQGIEVEGGARTEHDLIILATGFRTVDFMYPIEVTGAEGRSLADIWHSGPEALNGTAVESMPNFSMMYGPNTNLSHNSIILMIEAQSRYISALIKEVTDGATAGRQVVIQPRSQKLKGYNIHLQSDLSKTNYADPNCNSWYKLSETGKVVNNWSRTAVEYQELLSKVHWSDYDVSGADAPYPQTDRASTVVGRVVEESLGHWSLLPTTVSLLAIGLACSSVLQALRF